MHGQAVIAETRVPVSLILDGLAADMTAEEITAEYPAVTAANVHASRIANMKELRPPSAGRSEIRILLVFDPWRSVVLLVAGDKSGQWDKWYRTAIPRAEQLYDDYLAERGKEMGL